MFMKRSLARKRLEEVVLLRVTHPELSCAEIGRRVGLTRERVRQILSKFKLPTRAKREPQGYCAFCGKPLYKKRKFCSARCRSDYSKFCVVVCKCANCGKLFKRKLSGMKYHRKHGGNLFCSKKCTGAYLGRMRKKGGNAK
ncbi:DUF2116 family Zn-ribbon domain-containing protein [bacterium]|nr:DUF2116 family Zn-ribbon domain-containing protein [bacterium]